MLGDTLLLNYLNFQKIKINGFYEIILGKTDLVVKLEFFNRRIQPDWFPQIKLLADGIQRIKDHLCPGQRVVRYACYRVPDQMVVFHNLSPHSEHSESPLASLLHRFLMF